MKIQEAPLPAEIEKAIPQLLPEVVEYLKLEDAGFNPRDVAYSACFTVDDSVGFVVFDYAADDHYRPFAFVQYSLRVGLADSACMGCWPRTEGETLVWSIAEYFEMHPIRDE
jgi:hypothetical protein